MKKIIFLAFLCLAITTPAWAFTIWTPKAPNGDSLVIGLNRNGTTDTTGYGWRTDPNTGIIRLGADSLGFVTGGVVRLTIGETGATKLVLPDTTFSAVAGASAKKIIVGRLDDPAVMWNYAEFMQRAKNTSWWSQNGPFPVSWAITANNAQDSVIVWDRERATRYMVFSAGASNLIEDATPVLTDIKFLDGVLYVSGTGGADVTLIDFLRDRAMQYSTGGISQYLSTLNDRNGSKGWTTLNSGAAYSIVNNTVNAISAIRDPDGGLDEFGRPKQAWKAQTAGGESSYIPSRDAVYDSNITGSWLWGDFLGRGDGFAINSDVTRDNLHWKYAQQTIAADAYTFDEIFTASGSGSEDLSWTDAAVFSQVAAVSNASIAGNNSPLAVLGSDQGLAFLHSKRNDNTNGANIFIDASRNSPLGDGAAVLMWAAEDTIDSSPYANNLTRAGTGSNVTFTTDGAVGKAAYVDSTANGHLVRLNDLDFRRGTGSWSIGVAVKSSYATNPSANRFIYNLRTSLDSIELLFNSSGQLVARTTDDGALYDTITFAVDIHDALQHYVEYSRDGSTFRLRVDGEEVGTATATNVDTAVDPDTLFIGKNTGATLAFVGYVDEFSISNIARTAQKSRYAYNRILRGVQSSVDPSDALPGTSNNIKSVQVDPRSGHIITVSGAGSGADTAVAWDEFSIPIAKYSMGSATGNDAAVFAYAGVDSPAVYLGASNRTQWIQPDPKVSELARQTSNPAYGGGDIFVPSMFPLRADAVVVDSAGFGNVTRVNDAIAICLATGRRKIYIRNGTYSSKVTINGAIGNLDIEGESWRAIIDGGSDTAIAVSVAKNIHISNLTVRNTPAVASNSAIAFVSADSGWVDRVYVPYSDFAGVTFWLSACGRVTNCLLKGSDQYGVEIDGTALTDSLMVISENVIHGSGTANLQLTKVYRSIIVNNICFASTYGMITGNGTASYNVIHGNQCYGGTYGIYIWGLGSLNNIVSGNMLQGNTTANLFNGGTGTITTGDNYAP